MDGSSGKVILQKRLQFQVLLHPQQTIHVSPSRGFFSAIMPTSKLPLFSGSGEGGEGSGGEESATSGP